LYVDSGNRRRGAGRALVSSVAAIAHEAGVKEMIWSVYHANKPATLFYEKLGAQRITEVFFMNLRADAL
jgi:ribosomal protein S18 acetylase RimI-like enzyme